MIKEVLKDYRKELAKAEYNVWYYEKELKRPVKMGLEQAKEGSALWQRHVKSLREQIKSLEDYAIYRKNRIK